MFGMGVGRIQLGMIGHRLDHLERPIGGSMINIDRVEFKVEWRNNGSIKSNNILSDPL